MKSFLKRILSVIISVLLALCIMPVSAVHAMTEPVPYVDENGDPQTCTGYHDLDAPWWDHKISGWNVVHGNVTFSDDRQMVDGVAYIIIMDGSTLNIKKGLTVGPGSTLYIYGQSGGTGKLIVNEDKEDKHAGLGGENKGSCGTVIINGATVYAYGGSDAAGIGGGNEPSDGNVNSSITINRGKVYAYGGKYGAGIGGGDLSDGGTITINGGTVYAEGGQEAAAIGGGDGEGTKYGNGGTITINGGNVTAVAFEYEYNYNDECLGAGIGGGTEGGAGTITITGGKVYATGQRGGAGIGSGCDVNKKSNKSLIGGTIKITGGEVHGDTPEPLDGNLNFGGGAGIGSGRNSPGCDITISGGKVYAFGSHKNATEDASGDGGAGIGNSQHSSGGSITITGGTIQASTSCRDAAPIGKGAGGNKPTCTLNYPECKVYWWKNGIHISLEADRAQDAFKTAKDSTHNIYITPCDHPDLEYLSDEDEHFAHCDHCGADILESHTWKYVNEGEMHREVCKVCGYQGELSDHVFDKSGDHRCVCGAQGIKIDFDANGGSGEMADEFILKGTNYTLPSCGFTAPSGQEFIGWDDGYGNAYEPGFIFYGKSQSFTLTAQWGDNWHTLQVMIDAAENGDTIVLTKDYKATAADVEYLIDSGKDITIDLNGHTIDRNLTEADDQGSVFRVKGTLTIIDSSNSGSGVIKGGYPNGEAGGAFTVDGGTLAIKAGTIKECSGTAGAVYLSGGAVFDLERGKVTGTNGNSATVLIDGGSTFNFSGGYIEANRITGPSVGNTDAAFVLVRDGSFNMSGGSIMDNSSGDQIQSSGVRIGENGSFSVSGAPFIQRNGTQNVYLAQGQTIAVVGVLRQITKIGVTVEDEPGTGETRVLTDGLSGNGKYSSFISDNDAYMVRINGEKEAILGEPVEIPVVSVSIEPSELTLEIGEKATLTAVFTPEDALEQAVIWYAYDTSVATVNLTTGEVTGVSEGEATAYVITQDGGHQAECKVTVTQHVHEWLEATCTEPKTCSKCGQTEDAALGHDWGEWTVTTEPTCSDAGEQERTCRRKNCGEKETELTPADTDAHNWDEGTVTIEPTCTAAGEKTYTCLNNPQHTRTEEIPADPDAHAWGEWKETLAPTCTESGTETRTCSNYPRHTETRDVDPLDHDWNEGTVTTKPTCTAAGVRTYRCSRDSSHTRTEEIAATGHSLTKTEAVAATCTQAGNSEYYTCSACDRYFSDAAGENEIKEDSWTIAALDHNWGEWTEVTAATETEEGEEERSCGRCSEKETRAIPVLSHVHVLSKVEAKAATCEDDGNIEYWICDQGEKSCHRYFSDSEGNTEINTEDTVIKAIRHDWSEWEEILAPTCIKEGKKERTCRRENCGEKETKQIPVDPDAHDWNEGEITTEPTCTTVGIRKFTCKTESSHTKTEEVEALGHDWGEWMQIEAPTCTDNGTEKKVCGNDAGHTETRSIDRLGHNWGEWTETLAPTCTTPGTETRVCGNNSGHTETRETDALGHDIHSHEAKDPTCTEAGWEAYEECSRGDYTTYKEIPVLDHDLINHEAKDPTCTEAGWEAYQECSRCDYTTYVEIPALGHEAVIDPAKDPSPDEPGLTEGSHCGRCGEVLAAQKEIIGYYITSGEDSTWINGTDGTVKISIRRNKDNDQCFSHFRSVKIDGNELTKDTDYTAASGSTIIDLKASLLNSLSTGKHTVTITFDDGEVETSLIVKTSVIPGGKYSVPKTGIGSFPMFPYGILIVDCIGILVAKNRKKRKMQQ